MSLRSDLALDALEQALHARLHDDMVVHHNDVHAGMSIAGLYPLVATCEARGINPFAYLADVIPRVQDHPKRRLDELLPGPWSCAQLSV